MVFVLMCMDGSEGEEVTEEYECEFGAGKETLKAV